MPLMSRTTAVLTAAVIALLAGCSSTPPAEQSSGAGEAEVAAPILTKPARADHMLFVAGSKTARLTLDAAGKGTLEMSAVPTMTWFSDRPQHDAGTTAAADALKAFGWRGNGDDLGAAAPNAALTGDDLEDAAVMELLSASRTGDEITFEVVAVPRDVRQSRQDLSLTNAKLFIDSVKNCFPPSPLCSALVGADDQN
jgi:hypothetical protein